MKNRTTHKEQLPFLRLRSSVNVAFGDADAPPGRRGVLKQVGLDLVQGVPRLQIDVGLDDQARSQQWQPGQVIYSSAPEPEARPELEIVEVVDERSTLVDARPLCVDAAAADLASGIIDLPTSGRVVEVVAVDEDSDDVDYELEVQRGLAEIDPAAESHWSLGQPQAGAEAPYDRFWRESERRRHRLWLWIAAVLMGSVAVASMVQTEFWQRVSERLWPPPSTGQLAAAQLPEALRDDSPVAPTAAPVAPPLQPDAVDRGPGAPPEAPTAPPASQGETPAAAKQALIAVEREGGAVVLRLGLRGSATEARHYELADPDGLAINLPHARPAGAFGHYPINRGGIRTVWVRERLGGMQVRVFFDRTEAEQQPRLRIDEHQIEVRLGNGS